MFIHTAVVFASGVVCGALMLHAYCLHERFRESLRGISAAAFVTTTEQQPPLGLAMLRCSMCMQEQPHTGFAPKQARRPESMRKCRLCVETFNASDNSLAPASADADGTAAVAAADAATDAAGAAAVAAPGSFSAPVVASSTPTAAAAVVDSSEDPLRLARKAETVLRGRTERVCIILENCMDDLNHIAVLRTCDALGVLRVWLVEAAVAAPKAQEQKTRDRKAKQRGIECDPLLGFRRAQLYAAYLDVRTFRSTADAIAAARADGRELWVTDLAQEAWELPLERSDLAAELPERLAIVLGSESAGVSDEMLASADRRVLLPDARLPPTADPFVHVNARRVERVRAGASSCRCTASPSRSI